MSKARTIEGDHHLKPVYDVSEVKHTLSVINNCKKVEAD